MSFNRTTTERKRTMVEQTMRPGCVNTWPQGHDICAVAAEANPALVPL
jgi:hypothetical protein